jgi:D-alanyl-D-alanine carboxypeptidase
MAWLSSEARGRLRSGTVGLAAAAVALTITSDGADARHHHRLHVTYVHISHSGRTHHAEARGRRHSHSEDYSPPSSSIVVDGNSGATLEAANPDALRHPASLTKVMTLYLLFERLDAGKMRLDTQLKVSEHAAEQDPTKLNLKPGSTITVEDAIKGIVTRSANDAAVTIAENIGGDEDTFARMMTQKARALGMTRTVYRNASGLPDDEQNTTARDQALLGRAIQDRFPRYYKFFSTESFVFHGESIRGHNHLLGSVDGVDGIKTGFTRASGFNLLTSVHRDGRFLVAVVMGGHSSFERDAHMRDLISGHIKEAAVRRTAPVIAEGGESQQVAFTRAPMVSAPMVPTPVSAPIARADTTASANARVASAAGTNDMRPAVGSNDPIRPLLVRTVTFRTAPMQTASMAPMPALVQMPQQSPQQVAQLPQPVAPPAPAPAPQALPQPAPVQQAAQLPAPIPLPNPAAPQRPVEVASADPAPAPQVAAPQTVAPQTFAQQPAPKVAAVAAPVPVAAPAQVAPALIETASAAPAPQFQSPVQQQMQTVSAPTAAAIHAHETLHGGWLIQIGAFDDEDQARQHLITAQVKVRTALAGTDPFTEKVQKGDKALYRARFAGFDKATAETACKELKRSDFQCMALKD